MRGLIIKKEWLDKILSGKKTMEIRGSRVNYMGKIALIESGSGEIKGICILDICLGPLSIRDMKNTEDSHCVPNLAKATRYKDTYAWCLRSARRFRNPIPYDHPRGAVIWVKLSDEVSARIRRR